MKTFVEREVLLQVKRIYNNDEIIADLHRQLKEYGVKVGILESQIAELEDENKMLRKNGERNRQDEYVKNLKGTIEQLLKAKQKYKAESERWMGKFYTQYPKNK
jgi:poly(3-hydroxyalkanoate) synthetase